MRGRALNIEKMKNIKHRIRAVIAAAACSASAVSLVLLMLAGVYSRSMPDSYTVPHAGQLTFSSMPYITSRSVSKDTKASFSSNGSEQRALMLLGCIPIKTVTANAASPVMLMSGGDPFGIKLEAQGAVVVGINDIGGSSPARECGIQTGDVIISAAGKEVDTNQSFADIIMASKGRPTEVVIMRDGSEMALTITPKLYCGTYKAGVDIRDSSAGIGTVTFYDPSNGMYAGLGHAVCDSDTGEEFPCGSGSICGVEITGVNKSTFGQPGEIQGLFSGGSARGDILLNCDRGVYGNAFSIPSTAKAYPLGYRQEVETGKASIICTLDGGAPKEYSIEIESIDLSDSGVKDMVIHVTDETLLARAGGIVQGMSGSPIIQNGKLVGAVTHVFVKDTTRGYAIMADKMYSAALSCEGCNSLEMAG